MSDTNAQFHFALARVSAIQLLRSTGIDRARPSVIESLADIMVQYIQLLGIKSKEAAESAGRHACELEDAREALERVGSVRVTTRQNAREEEGVVQFITWCMSDEATHMRRIAGEGQDEMGEEVTADWLNREYLPLHMAQAELRRLWQWKKWLTSCRSDTKANQGHGRR